MPIPANPTHHGRANASAPLPRRQNRVQGYGLNDASQVSQCRGKVRGGLASFLQESGQVSFCVVESNFGREKTDTLARIGLDQLAHPATQDGANEDVRVEDDHFIEPGSCLCGAPL